MTEGTGSPSSSGGQRRRRSRRGKGSQARRQGQRSSAGRNQESQNKDGRSRPNQSTRPRRASSTKAELGVAADLAAMELSGPAVITAEEVAANRAKARQLSVSAGAVLGVVLGIILGVALGIAAGFVVGAVVGVLALVLCVAGVSRLIRTGAKRRVIRRIGARRVVDDEFPRLENVTDGLCATFGLKAPELYVIDDAVPNSCSLGEDPDDGAIVVTTGLLDGLGLLELEGVVAHELSHIKRCDTAVFGVAVSVAGPLAKLTHNDRWLLRALGTGREYRADQIAAAAVRYAPELHDALVVLHGAPSPAPRSYFSSADWAATRWIWIDPMVGAARNDALEDCLDATAVRIAALEEW